MRGHIRQWRKPGVFKIWLEHPTVEGRRRRETFIFRGARKDAEAKMADRIAAIERSDFSRSERSTVGEVADLWLKARQPNVCAKTFARYAGIIRDYVKPTIGDVQLRKLTPLHVESAVAKWRGDTAKGRSSSGKLGQRSLHHNFVTLNTMLRQAVRWNLLPRNPCEAVSAPAKGHADVVALNESDAVALLEGLGESALAPIVHFVLHTGLRRGEALALRWTDLDLERRCATITRSLEQCAGELRFKDTKTKRSRRPVPLTSDAVAMLKTHRAQQNSVRLQTPAYNPEGLVFPDPLSGAPWAPDRFSMAFGRRARRLGLAVTFHGLRHSFATIALRARVPMKVVSDILGHTTTAITADLYTHVFEDMQREAVESVELALATAKREAL